MFAIAAAFFAGWLVLSAINQFKADALIWLHRYDSLGLLPNWKFFAPSPLKFDLVLLYRTSHDGGNGESIYGDWAVAAVAYERNVYDFFFNTSRRLNKAITDLYSFIIDLSRTFPIESVCRSAPVKALSALVVQRAQISPDPVVADGTAERRSFQFAIVRVEGVRASTTAVFAFVSEPAPLGK
jgi:hypothetical protein